MTIVARIFVMLGIMLLFICGFQYSLSKSMVVDRWSFDRGYKQGLDDCRAEFWPSDDE